MKEIYIQGSQECVSQKVSPVITTNKLDVSTSRFVLYKNDHILSFPWTESHRLFWNLLLFHVVSGTVLLYWFYSDSVFISVVFDLWSSETLWVSDEGQVYISTSPKYLCMTLRGKELLRLIWALHPVPCHGKGAGSNRRTHSDLVVVMYGGRVWDWVEDEKKEKQVILKTPFMWLRK